MKLLRRLEPLWWAVFGLGGTLAALALPAHIFLSHIAGPIGWVTVKTGSSEGAAALLGNPWVKAYVAVLLALTFFHAAHRLRSLPHELTLPVAPEAMGAVLYGVAALLSIAAAALLVAA